MFIERHHIRLLLDLARLGSLSRAAGAQNITQSAASQRLHEAERRLGIALTSKQGRSLTLTEAGQHLVAKAQKAEHILVTAESEALWIARASGRRLRLILTVFDRFDFLPQLVSMLSTQDITLSILRNDVDQAGTLLSDGFADLLLTPAPMAPLGFSSYTLFRDQLVGVCAPDHPLANHHILQPKTFIPERYLTYSDQPGSGFEYEQFFQPAGVMPGRVERIESVAMLTDVVASGHGVSILPALATRADADAGRIVSRPLSESTRLEWSLIYRPGIDEIITAMKLVDIFRECFQKQ